MSRLSVVGALCVLGLVAVGCGHTELHQALLRPPSPPKGRDAELYLTGPPPRPFYDVAILQAIGYGGDASDEHVAHALARQGGELGCDAVIRVVLSRGVGVTHGSGVCVNYLDSGSPPRFVAPPVRPPVQPAPATPPQAM